MNIRQAIVASVLILALIDPALAQDRWLESIARESDWESTLVLESLAFAAASMERFDQQRAIDERLTFLHGYKYETLLSPEV